MTVEENLVEPAGRDVDGHALLELQRLSKFFGNVIALQNITTSVRAGEVTCVLGDNGAGKSTLIKILAGVHRHDEGHFLMEGEKVDVPLAARRQGGRHRHRLPGPGDGAADVDLAQLLARLRADDVARHDRHRRKAKQIAVDEMAKMGIDVRDPEQPVGTLSGGERQSVAIARAVYFGAKVLILDEPTAALGVKQSGVVLRYIVAARDRGLGVIFITHNPHHAYPVGDRFLILKRGQSLGNFAKDEITRDELVQLMAGGAELEALSHEIESLVARMTRAVGQQSTGCESQLTQTVGVLVTSTADGRAGQRRPLRRRRRCRLARRPALRQVDRRHGDQRRRRRRPARPPQRRADQGRRRPVRRLRRRQAAVVRGRHARSSDATTTLRTPLAFAALTPPEDPELLFYRVPKAPDMQLQPGDVDAATIGDVGVLWVAGSAMAEEPARSTIAGILAVRGRRPHTVLDLDYRAVLWPSEREASTRHRRGDRLGHGRHRQPRRVPRRRRHRRSRRGGRRPARPRRRASPSSSSAATASSSPPPTSAPSSRRGRSRSCAGSAPATPSAGRSSTACSPAGRLLESSSTPMPPGRSSPGG